MFYSFMSVCVVFFTFKYITRTQKNEIMFFCLENLNGNESHMKKTRVNATYQLVRTKKKFIEIILFLAKYYIFLVATFIFVILN